MSPKTPDLTKKARTPGAARRAAARTRAPAPRKPFLIVGIGASAGGLEAFTNLIENLPAATGTAYVLVQHLDPTHESALPELLARLTVLPVIEVRETLRVEADHVYIMPSAMDLAIVDGHLKLFPRALSQGLHMPIDHFFRSLAEVQAERAIGVILSGTGSDGTLGLQAIKAGGGICLAQEPQSAKYDSMPRSAIAAGCVDTILPAEALAREIARLADVFRGDLRPEGDGREQRDEAVALERILGHVAKVTGNDLGSYKEPTMLRRVRRRMALYRIAALEDYVRFVESQPAEVHALYEDLLIHVTSFFRNDASFETLSQKVFPELTRDRSNESPVRFWVPGCSTGEEVYSLAICLLESLGEMGRSLPIQIFGTDVRSTAIEQARAGIYLENIAADVSPERLERFFVRVDERFQVSKPVRDLCVFAQHDLIRDPPFSRMDLISCRNVLIYFNPETQKRIFSNFHYALNAGGYLVLGASENAGTSSRLFRALDREQKIFVPTAVAARPVFGSGSGRGIYPRAGMPLPSAVGGRADVQREADRILLSRYSPPGVLVDTNLEILLFRGDTQLFLEHGQGDASLSLPQMAQKGLLASLREMIQEVQATQAAVRRAGVKFRHLDGFRQVDLEVLPVHGPLSRQSCFLILFHSPAEGRPSRPVAPRPRRRQGKPGEDQVRLLEEELTATRDYLRSVAEEQSAANSALEIANQEILSSNEELQSLNEELETAKEELQSSNEELTTLNEELHQRNSELAEVSDDLLNLLSALHVPVVLLSRELIIRRFTPGAARLLGFRASSVGQPLELSGEIELPDLAALVLEVMEAGAEKEREIQDRQGAWHLLRLLPYRSRDNGIEGAVMLLIDIDALKRTADAVARSRDFADAVIETVREPLLVLGADLRVERINRAFAETFRVSREEAVGRLFFDLSEGQWDIPELRRRLDDVLSSDSEFHDLEVEQVFRGIGRRILVLAGRRVRQETTGSAKILLALDDRTKEKEAERERASLFAREQVAARRAEEGVRIKDEFLATVSHELRGPLSAMSGWLQVLEMRSDPATFARGLAAIRDNVAAQERLVADLLDASQMMAVKLRLAPHLIDLLPVVDAAVEAVRAAVEAKGLRLELRHDAAPILILGDTARMQQIAWNLLSNAVKFTPQGGAIDVWVGRTETSIQLRVADTGTGIGKDFLPHVFERFRQEKSSYTRSQLGLGLGLAIVRQLAELHGGTVAAESPGEGEGATFTVTLPMPPVGPGEPEAPVGRELAGLRVLVVEDDRNSREMLTALLEGYGAEVTATASASEAVMALGKAVPDVLVSDIGMAEESGYDLIRRIRTLPAERGGTVPALAFTAYSSEADRQEAFAAGFQLHLGKPSEPAKLRSAIAHLARSSL